jgi:hypothetical protein
VHSWAGFCGVYPAHPRNPLPSQSPDHILPRPTIALRLARSSPTSATAVPIINDCFRIPLNCSAVWALRNAHWLLSTWAAPIVVTSQGEHPSLPSDAGV